MAFNGRYSHCAANKQYACNYHHIALMRAYKMQQVTSTHSSYNLRYAYSAVEESEICTLVAVTLKSIGDKSKRHGKHSSPSATYKQEGKHKQILIADERHKNETYATDNKTYGVCHLLVLELRQRHSPKHRTDGLPEEQHTNPVARLLISL